MKATTKREIGQFVIGLLLGFVVFAGSIMLIVKFGN